MKILDINNIKTHFTRAYKIQSFKFFVFQGILKDSRRVFLQTDS